MEVSSGGCSCSACSPLAKPRRMLSKHAELVCRQLRAKAVCSHRKLCAAGAGELVEVNSGGLVLFCFFSPGQRQQATTTGRSTPPQASPREGCCVVKFSASRLTTQSEQFANELTRHLGVCAPACRILRKGVRLFEFDTGRLPSMSKLSWLGQPAHHAEKNSLPTSSRGTWASARLPAASCVRGCVSVFTLDVKCLEAADLSHSPAGAPRVCTAQRRSCEPSVCHDCYATFL